MSPEGGLRLAEPVLALDLGGTRIRVAIVDTRWHVRARREAPTPVERGPDAIVAECLALLRAAVADPVGAERGAPTAVGISTPGPVDPWSGRVVDPPNLGPGFRDIDLAPRLEAGIGLPAVLDRDTQAAALAEATVGAAAGTRDFVYVTVSTGVGGAVMIDGRLLRGPDGTAGELGHLLIDLDGPPCGCGAQGHLEAFASGTGMGRQGVTAAQAGRSPALAARLRERADGRLSGRDIAEAADLGDVAAIAIVEGARRAFAAACVTIADVFDPDLIVVGGGIADAQGERLLAPARLAVASQAFRAPSRRTRVVAAALGDDVGLVGAAALVAERSGAGPR
ncbi:MAG: ROK family protein [Chloroflexota bacterium]